MVPSGALAFPSNRLFSFGVISDVQYADIPDGVSFAGTPRYYRSSLISLRSAVSGWRSSQVDFGIHLGDIIDGFNPPDKAATALDAIIAEFDRLERPHWHMIGNHCLYNQPRQVLNEKLRMIGPQGVAGASFYSLKPHPDWRFLVLDGYDCSMLGWPPGHPLHEEAKAILDKRNPNKDKNNPTRPVGTAVTERRFVKFGGAVSSVQMEWLREQLTEAQQCNQRVITFCHLPLHPGTGCPYACLLWNYVEVLELLHQFSNVCVATFAGHTHQDGYFCDEYGIHHRVFKAVVETPPPLDCYGIVDVHSDRLDVRGVGTMMSQSLSLRQAIRRKSTLKPEPDAGVLHRQQKSVKI